MALLIALILFTALMATITYAGYRHYSRPSRYYDQLAGSPLVVAAGGEGRLSPGEGLGVRLFRVIGEKVPIDPQEAALTRRYLIGAGYRSDSAPAIYYGMRVLFFIGFVASIFLLRNVITPIPVLRVVLMIAAVAGGLFIPGFFLDWLVSRRQETLRLSLPDALDLMVICVEAGLGLDQAILNVSRELAITHKEISEELSLVSLEMQAGKRRAEALRNLAERTGEPELRKFVAILIQTDRFGTSMADSLRTHSDFMRVRRRQEAEERANKVGVKLIFPIFFFILPSMLVVVAGPGFLQVFKYLLPVMRQFRAS
ncbi:MAG: type II secretion system F family protein [Bryobacterales bacterium]|nr:type II secretion system F family protein [Bryobacterales bacterium]